MGGSDFYVYVMFRPNGVPCYVGKGKGRRAEDMNRDHNPHLMHIIRQAGGRLPVALIRESLTENEAHATEMAFIAAIGRERNGGPLVNLTDGGEGQVGWIPSELTRARIRAANTGRKVSDETRAKMSAARKGKKKSPEHAAKIGQSRKGKKAHQETLAHLTAIRRSPEWREAARRRALAQHEAMTDEQRAVRKVRISAATKEAMAKPETVSKVRASAIENYSRRERTPEGRFA